MVSRSATTYLVLFNLKQKRISSINPRSPTFSYASHPFLQMHKVIFVPRRTGPHPTPPARTRGLEALAGDFTEIYLDFCVTSKSVEVSASARVGEFFRAVEVLREAKSDDDIANEMDL